MIARISDGTGGGGGAFLVMASHRGSSSGCDDEPAESKAHREKLEALRAAQRANREARIDALVRDAEARGSCPADRAYWSLVYDLELAPMTTNRQQLLAIGIEAPPLAEIPEGEVSTRLWRVIRGLRDIYTYLIHTDHLSDRELYERLVSTILDEPVHEICDGSGGQEFIDLAGGRTVEDRRAWLSFYASDAEREGARGNGEEVPERRAPPYPRSAHLPRPS
ncbi:MAG: hypothetical protein KF724_02250 [Phycisphaeraceae bacterium]|nr:hypothetical protein [Phycisphaeraceae bacterium]